MTKFYEAVPPGSVGWVVFASATDPATDPNNNVGPGKLWVELDDDTTPTTVLGMHIWSVDDSAWLDFPIGSSGVVADGDYGDIVVSGSGSVWSFDSAVVTAAAKTVLDDASVSAMLATMGGAPLASPTFTGTPSLPTGTTGVTQSAGDNSTKLATTAYVDAAAGGVADGDKGDITVSGSGTVWNIDAGVVTGTEIASDVALAGNPTTTTQSSGNSSTRIATTAFVADAVAKQKEVFTVAVSDETTAITTGAAKVTFRMPFAMTLTEVRASLSASSSSGNPAIDVNEGGVSIFSTTLTIDSGEKTSTTAATPAVISDSSLADDAEMTVDIDTAGTGAKGLKITLIGTRT